MLIKTYSLRPHCVSCWTTYILQDDTRTLQCQVWINHSLQQLPVDAGFVSGSKGDGLIDVDLINSALQQIFLKVKRPEYETKHTPWHRVEINCCETMHLPPRTPSGVVFRHKENIILCLCERTA